MGELCFNFSFIHIEAIDHACSRGSALLCILDIKNLELESITLKPVSVFRSKNEEKFKSYLLC